MMWGRAPCGRPFYSHLARGRAGIGITQGGPPCGRPSRHHIRWLRQHPLRTPFSPSIDLTCIFLHSQVYSNHSLLACTTVEAREGMAGGGALAPPSALPMLLFGCSMNLRRPLSLRLNAWPLQESACPALCLSERTSSMINHKYPDHFGHPIMASQMSQPSPTPRPPTNIRIATTDTTDTFDTTAT